MRKDYMKNCQFVEQEITAAFNKKDRAEREVFIRTALRKLKQGGC